MKLPKTAPGHVHSDPYTKELFDECQKAAIRLTIRTGIIVKAVIKPVKPLAADIPDDDEWEIIFRTMGKSYDNLKEVRRALNLKAFQ